MTDLDDTRGAVRWARPIGLVLLALAAAYLLVTNTLAFAIPNGIVARAMAPWSGVATGKYAEALVQQSKSMADVPAAAGAARDALEREPYDFRAARTLASIDALAGRPARAEQVFRLIGQNTLREPFTHLRLLNYAFERKDSSGIVREAEILLRQRPQMAAQVYPFLIYLVDNRLAVQELIGRLNQQPDWRGGFFDALGEQSKAPDAAYAFLTRLRASAHPATPAELRVWLLYQLGQVGGDATTDRWRALQTPPLPAREALLRNPDFEGSRAPQPFDWTFFRPEDSFGEIGPSPTGRGKSLFVEMVGRDDVSVAAQLLTLAPGRYQLVTRIYPVSDTSRGEASFELTCARGTGFAPIGRRAITAASDTWSTWAMTFTVPAGCRTQRLSIGMQPGALSAEQRLYFDDMAIRPIGAPRR